MNSKIFKNSIYLFFRLFITTILVLVSTRIVLDRLGVEDFGIYNVITGAVFLFTFINNAMASSTQRNITFFSEKGTQKEKNEIFNASIRIHFLFSIIAFILLQTIGQILFYYFLNIPEGKLHSAQIAYQCVIFIFFFNIISVPFQAAINSYEDMDVLAKAGVIDSVLKLLAAYSLSYFNYNRLEIYSSMFLLITVIINFYYFYYCRINYKDAVIGLSPIKKSTYIQLTSFASWTVLGSFASLIRKQGSVILLNMFLGPIINAAYGIANQIANQISAFSESLLKAVAPSIVKNFSQDNFNNVNVLLFATSRYSFFLFSIITLPLYFEMNFILNIWLKTVPDYTLVFSKLILYNVMLDVIIGPMITAIQATGRIKTYQIISGLTYLLNLPIAYFFLHKGYPAESVVFSNIIFTLIMGIIRLYFLKSLLGLKLNLYFKNVIIPIIFFLIFLILGIFLIYINFSEGFIRLIITCISSLIFGVISLYTFGINYNERQIINKAIAKIKK